MGLDLSPRYGQTPLEEDEKEGLLIPAITTREELDEFEQQNIENAMQWLMHRKKKPDVVLTEAFVKRLHRLMFGDVWKWAGEWRRTDKNIGIDKWQITSQLRQLLDDARYWQEQGTYPPDEIAIRFKHRIVLIHCFPNGNGRHSRLMADVIVEKLFHRPVFTWGSGIKDARKVYLAALREADRGDVLDLVAFARG